MGRRAAGAASVVACLVMTGCSAQEGPMQLPQGLGMALVPTDRGAFMTLQACSTEGPLEVELVRVEPVETYGTDDVGFRVLWPTEDEPAEFGAGPVPVPATYGPVAGSRGRLVPCRGPQRAPERDLDIAVVLPSPGRKPVFVRDVAVTYLVEGKEYRATADVQLGICGRGPSHEQTDFEACAD
jgi:hypothetical protein